MDTHRTKSITSPHKSNTRLILDKSFLPKWQVLAECQLGWKEVFAKIFLIWIYFLFLSIIYMKHDTYHDLLHLHKSRLVYSHTVYVIANQGHYFFFIYFLVGLYMFIAYYTINPVIIAQMSLQPRWNCHIISECTMQGLNHNFWAHLCLCTVGSYASLSFRPSVCD